MAEFDVTGRGFQFTVSLISSTVSEIGRQPCRVMPAFALPLVFNADSGTALAGER